MLRLSLCLKSYYPASAKAVHNDGGSMLLKKITAALIVSSLASAPVVAQAAPLGTVGSANLRASAPAGEASEAKGRAVIALVVLLLIAGGLVVGGGGGESEDPETPPVSF